MGVEYFGARAIPRLELGVAVMEYMEQANEFVGTQVLPVFRTQKQKAVFPAITRESITRDADTKRAARGNYNRDGFSAKDKSYSCEEHGLEGVLDDTERALYATDFDAELVTTRITTRRVMQAQEKRIADLLFNTTTFTGSALFTDNSGNRWSDPNSNVIAQVRAAKAKVRANCGMEANALIMSTTNIERLKANKDIIDAIKYTARASDAEIRNALSDLFGIKFIFEGKAIRNSAKEGKSFISADIWSSVYAMLAVVDGTGQDLAQPCIGRTFLWQTDSPDNAVVEQYRSEETRSDIYRVRQHVDEMIIDEYFGHLMKVDN